MPVQNDNFGLGDSAAVTTVVGAGAIIAVGADPSCPGDGLPSAQVIAAGRGPKPVW